MRKIEKLERDLRKCEQQIQQIKKEIGYAHGFEFFSAYDQPVISIADQVAAICKYLEIAIVPVVPSMKYKVIKLKNKK